MYHNYRMLIHGSLETHYFNEDDGAFQPTKLLYLIVNGHYFTDNMNSVNIAVSSVQICHRYNHIN